MLTLYVSSGFDESALGQLRCDWRFSCGLGLDRLSLRRLRGKLLSEGIGGDVVDGAGSALHLIATTLQKGY
jgi:hypothetical protein